MDCSCSRDANAIDDVMNVLPSSERLPPARGAEALAARSGQGQAKTESGHIESSTLKKQHAAALTAGDVSPLVIYYLRHTCTTRWAKVLSLPVVQKLAGHTSISTTMRYVHLNDADVLAAMTKAEEVHGGHTFRHTGQNTTRQAVREIATTD
jgi:integrase